MGVCTLGGWTFSPLFPPALLLSMSPGVRETWLWIWAMLPQLVCDLGKVTYVLGGQNCHLKSDNLLLKRERNYIANLLWSPKRTRGKFPAQAKPWARGSHLLCYAPICLGAWSRPRSRHKSPWELPLASALCSSLLSFCMEHRKSCCQKHSQIFSGN